MFQEGRRVVQAASFPWLARNVLGCDPSITSVMALDTRGKMLAHEVAIDENDLENDGASLLLYSEAFGALIFVRFDQSSDPLEVETKVRDQMKVPVFAVTR